MYSNLFLLKNMESLVKQMNSSKEVNLSIKEHLLTSATDMVECRERIHLGHSPLRALSPAALSSSALSYCSRDEELPIDHSSVDKGKKPL